MIEITAGAPTAPVARATGRVALEPGARIGLIMVRLDSIREVHSAISDRDARLDIVGNAVMDLGDWNEQSLDIVLATSPPWLLPRGGASDPHHVVICGGQFLPALRRFLPADSEIPAVVVHSKFQAGRFLQMAATHALAIHASASCMSEADLDLLIKDAEAAGYPVLNPGLRKSAQPRRAPRRAKTESR